jgi:16S rRNA (adenine1518-N6/adenine1519-N6)-dimethyltransferase
MGYGYNEVGRSMSFAPKRSFSQNFLTDPRAADSIVGALNISADDEVLEIGPGKGVLTRLLAKARPMRLTAIDLDKRAIEHLELMPEMSSPNITLLHADVLHVNLEHHWSVPNVKNRKVVGNIPYAITSDILFWLFYSYPHLSTAVILMQREVAARCTASPRTKEYGIVSVASWFVGTAKSVRVIPPGAFFPKPSVHSTVVQFTFRSQRATPIADFQRFVRAAFSQRRKVLTNSLDHWCKEVIGKGAREVAEQHAFQWNTMRAEECAPEALLNMYEVIVSGAT